MWWTCLTKFKTIIKAFRFFNAKLIFFPTSAKIKNNFTSFLTFYYTINPEILVTPPFSILSLTNNHNLSALLHNKTRPIAFYNYQEKPKQSPPHVTFTSCRPAHHNSPHPTPTKSISTQHLRPPSHPHSQLSVSLPGSTTSNPRATPLSAPTFPTDPNSRWKNRPKSFDISAKRRNFAALFPRETA